MKPANIFGSGCTFLFGLFALVSLTAHAQLGGASPAPSGVLSASLGKLFGENQAFSAKAEALLQPAGSSQSITMTMAFAMREGRMRMEFDTTQMVGTVIPPDAAESLKKIGMHKMVNIFRPDTGRSYVIYPGLEAYIEMPLPGSPSPEEIEQVKLEQTKIGEETVNGHACIKNRTVAIAPDGTRKEAITWNATDLNQFPIQLEFEDQGNKVRIQYRDIQMNAPSLLEFEAPKEYTKHEDLKTIMEIAMQRMIKEGGLSDAPIGN